MSVTRIGLEREIGLVLARDHPNPHHVLGAHPAEGGVAIRVYRPGATAVRALFDERDAGELDQVDPGGVFEGDVPGASLPLRYRLEVEYASGSTFVLDDPYRFLPTLGELDLYLAGEGRHEELYAKLGVHLREVDGVAGAAVRRLGACRPVGQRRRRLQRLGRPAAPDADARVAPASGSSSSRRSSRGRTTSSRSARRTAGSC